MGEKGAVKRKDLWNRALSKFTLEKAQFRDYTGNAYASHVRYSVSDNSDT